MTENKFFKNISQLWANVSILRGFPKTANIRGIKAVTARGLAVIAVFSLVLSSFSIPTTAVARDNDDDKKVTVCHYNGATWDNLQMKKSQVGVHDTHDSDFVIDGENKKCPGQGTGDSKMVIVCH